MDGSPASDFPSNSLAGVKSIIAVGSGKGGVGKSTIAALLAVGFSRKGRKVALLDGDVYGPSLPKMTGTEGAQPYIGEDGGIIPPEKHGIPVLSMGHLVPPDQAVIWRGPLAQKYVKEFLDKGAWGNLDCLIVDLPPGTGDIPLTLAQSIPLTGAVIVCTPQDVALSDAVRALRMYQKLGVQPLGIVENMSYYVCPQCGHRAEIFDHGGAAETARKLEVPFLGAVPLDIAIRKNGDTGALLENFTETDRIVRDALEQIVDRLLEQLDQRKRNETPSPELNVE